MSNFIVKRLIRATQVSSYLNAIAIDLNIAYKVGNGTYVGVISPSEKQRAEIHALPDRLLGPYSHRSVLGSTNG